MSNNTRGLLFAGFTAFLWGFLAIALKVSVSELKPVTVVWFRFTIAFFLLLITLLVFDREEIKKVKKLPPLVFAAGFLLGINYLGFISGIKFTSPGTAQVFIQIGPVSLAIAGIVFFGEKFTMRHFAGLIILLSGFTLFFSQHIENGAGANENFTRGVGLILLGGFCWAGFSILQKIMVRNHKTYHLNLVIFGISALGFMPFAELSVIPGLSTNEWLLLIFLGLNTYLAYGSLAFALKYAEANKISMVITLNPVITFIAMAILEVLAVPWIEYENLNVLSVLGAGLALTGVMIVVIRKRKNNKKAVTEMLP